MTGAALVAALDSLADLRIAVFRAFPYLYDGDHAYERAYLTAYANSPGALVVGAFAGDRLVGAATAAPMADHAAAFAAPFQARGMDISDIYYFGESVLLPDWRGHGIGHAFFDRREARARELGFPLAAFCAVIRPPDHPRPPRRLQPARPLLAQTRLCAGRWADRPVRLEGYGRRCRQRPPDAVLGEKAGLTRARQRSATSTLSILRPSISTISKRKP